MSILGLQEVSRRIFSKTGPKGAAAVPTKMASRITRVARRRFQYPSQKILQTAHLRLEDSKSNCFRGGQIGQSIRPFGECDSAFAFAAGQSQRYQESENKT